MALRLAAHSLTQVSVGFDFLTAINHCVCICTHMHRRGHFFAIIGHLLFCILVSVSILHLQSPKSK